MARTIRSILWLSVLGGVGAAGWKFWTDRRDDGDRDKGNWAPVPTPASGSASHSSAAAQGFSSGTDSAPATSSATKAGSGRAGAPTSAASKPTTAKASPKPATAATGKTAAAKTSPAKKPSKQTSATATNKLWVEPGANGSCPADFPVKANQGSKIFHVPSGGSYKRTKAERCYATPEDAESDGFRASKR